MFKIEQFYKVKNSPLWGKRWSWWQLFTIANDSVKAMWMFRLHTRWGTVYFLDIKTPHYFKNIEKIQAWENKNKAAINHPYPMFKGHRLWKDRYKWNGK
ncbi:MAG: hypothetical protein GY701_21395 [Sulfitobacter sp.]|nr:hypothetical protein [Sulfitobacter sp.]